MKKKNTKKKSQLAKLQDHRKTLLQNLQAAPSQQSKNKIELQIIEVDRKILISRKNNFSKLNNANPFPFRGGAPGLGKRS